MIINKNNFSESALLMGASYLTSKGIEIPHPKIKQIVDIGERDYFSYVNLFCSEPQDYMVQLWDSNIDYENISSYDLFIILFSSSKDYYNSILNKLWGIDDFEVFRHDNKNLLVSISKEVLINESEYFEISQFLKKIHVYKNKERPNPKSQEVKEFIIEIEREEMQDSDNTFNFSSLLSSLIWGNTSSINYFNIGELSIYQFKDGLERLNKIKEYKNTMMGIYNQVIDAKKINFNKVNWMSKID